MVERRVVVAGTAHVDVAPVGDIDVGAEHSVDRRVANLGVSFDHGAQRMAVHVWRRLHAEVVQDGRTNVDGRGQAASALVGDAGARVPDEERNVRGLVVPRHARLAPPVVFAEQEAVVGDHEQHGVLPHVVPVHEVDHGAEVVVALGQQGCVLIAQVLHRVGILGNPFVVRPVEVRPVKLVVVSILPLLQREEGLVRVERLYLQVPVVGVAVGFEEFKAGRKGLRLRRQALLLHVFAVHPVLTGDAAQVVGNLRVGHLTLPGIAFLAAHVHPA